MEVGRNRTLKKYSKTSILGDVTKASKGKGERMMEHREGEKIVASWVIPIEVSNGTNYYAHRS
ncbi:hypothetical protein M1O47_03700 [Dehalococcoidia bacterium]|nr:hypothetical protein [Dehalococcoidia bacterium]